MHKAAEYRPALSVLFNAFIFCQIFNEINARRINDEYTIFVGLFNNPIFVGVIAITVIFQVNFGRLMRPSTSQHAGCRGNGYSLHCLHHADPPNPPIPRPLCPQVIIINVPFINTKFFKVQPLKWQEWLVTVAIGFGAIPVSLLTRFLSKALPETCLRGTRVATSTGRTPSGAAAPPTSPPRA